MNTTGMNNNDEDRYIPGTCNIGKEEVAKRRKSMMFAGALVMIIISSMLLFHAGKIWRFFVFFPAVSFAVGVQQVYFKFCVAFGMKGFFNFKDLGESVSIEEAEMRRLDKAKATKMLVISLLSGLVITILFYLMP
ncbi:MAG TPA: hypothetical protein VK783_11790 [Bacteroidia bacterium]|jgi:hypothetical protein|nr:hypothetical protein [Bacteroidia bacterium]